MKMKKTRPGAVVSFVDTSSDVETGCSSVRADDETTEGEDFSKLHHPANNRRASFGNIKPIEEADDEDGASASTSTSASSLNPFRTHWASSRTITILILLLSVGTCVAFVAVGVINARNREEDDFQRNALDLVKRIQASWDDYVNAASLVHGRCRHHEFTREDFRELYEYLVNGGLDFKAVQFDPFVPHEKRQEMEDEARAFYAENYPHVNYQGFRGFEPGIPGLSPRSDHPFYYPIHYQEPIPGNEAAIDLDYYSSASRRETVNAVLTKGLPAVTPRLLLVKTPNAVNRCTPDDSDAYGVVLMHPGVNLTTQPDVWPYEFSSIVICMPQLLLSAAENQGESAAVYVHDSSGVAEGGDAEFLGALRVDVARPSNAFTLLDEVPLSSVNDDLMYRSNIQVANRLWTVTVVPVDGTYKPHVVFVILGGVIIFLAGVLLAAWMYTNTLRMTKLNQVKNQAEAEKAQLILDNARQATRAERELNDFIAHEVRNPVAAAIAACSFIKSSIHKEPPLADEESKLSAREDVDVIDNSLKFVNDLLRNMLDMHRAANKQLHVNKISTDVLHDVLEPVHAMLHRNGDYNVEIEVECEPRSMHVMTDPLRLKQVMLNLGRNSSKFVTQGFIRLRAAIVHGSVQLSVEDSGSGIPPEKRERLFSKFQESLDQLSQGTGIGLFLCKNLVELMGGAISIDEHYDSGIPYHPGTRFVVDLKAAPEDETVSAHGGDEEGSEEETAVFRDPSEDPAADNHNSDTTMESSGSSETGVEMAPRKPPAPAAVGSALATRSVKKGNEQELPRQLRVLLVDDDAVIRKMFSRAVATVAPEWTFRQAANGETALHLCLEEGEHFDLIFMDMYMASVEKQLLGTETVVELRAGGVTSRICGLSANDKELEFLDAGADVFTFKPFPCAPAPLTSELLRVLYS